MVYVSRKTLCSRVYIPYEKLSKVSRCSMCFSQLNLHKWWTMNHQIIWMQQMSSAHWAAHFNVICFQRSGITDMCMNFVRVAKIKTFCISSLFLQVIGFTSLFRAFLFLFYKLGMYYSVYVWTENISIIIIPKTLRSGPIWRNYVYIFPDFCVTRPLIFFSRKRCEKTSSTDFISITSFINHTFRDFSWQFHSI